MSRVLLVGGGSDLQPRLRAVSEGLSTVALCRATVLPWVHQLGDNKAVVVVHDDSPLEKWLAAARFLHAEYAIDTVAALAEIDQDKAAAIAEDLGLEFHSTETVRLTVDKNAMRERLRTARVEKVPFRQVADVAELAEFFAEAGPPLLIKPSEGRASAGIAVIRSAEDIEPAFRRADGADGDAPRLERSTPMAERYVEGPEYSVEALTHRGTHYVFAVTEKLKDETTKVELGHVVPARIGADAQEAILAHVRACLTALGVERGITHTEVILGKDGPFLVETHLRQAGDWIIDLVTAATGIDITDLLLRQIAGADLAELDELASRRERPHYHAAGAIGFLAPPDCGRLAGIDGLEQAGELPGVQFVHRLIEDGGELSGLRSSYSRLACIRVEAEDAEAAVRLRDEAMATLHVRVDEG